MNFLLIKFGSLVEVSNEQAPTNTIPARTISAVAPNPCTNASGSYHFLNLETGKRIIRSQWTVLPLTTGAIDQVSFLAAQQSQPLLNDRLLVFERRPVIPLPDAALLLEASASSTPTVPPLHDPHFFDHQHSTDIAMPSGSSICRSELHDLLADAADFTPAAATRQPPSLPNQRGTQAGSTTLSNGASARDEAPNDDDEISESDDDTSLSEDDDEASELNFSIRRLLSKLPL